MATVSHPAPLAPRHSPFPKLRRPRRHEPAPMAASDAAGPATGPNPYTRSAVPLAVFWFLLPALALVLSMRLGWTT